MTTTAQDGKALTTEKSGLRGLLDRSDVKARLNEVLGKEAAVFASSVLTVVNGNKALQDCDPKSILNAAFQAAALKLPITPGLGQAAIVPYKGVAQFQVMVRGIIQLAHRTGLYERLNLAEVHEGELVEYNEFTGEVKLDAKKKKSDKVIGYFFFFKLTNGYRHEVFKTTEALLAHGKKYSQAFKNGKGPWVDMPEVMCAKTIVKNTLAKWGPLSSEMRTAFKADQAAIDDKGTPTYIDADKVEDFGTAGDGEHGLGDGPKRASETGTEGAQLPLTPVLVEDVTFDKKKDDWRVLIDGVSIIATKEQAEAAKVLCRNKTPVKFSADNGVLVEISAA